MIPGQFVILDGLQPSFFVVVQRYAQDFQSFRVIFLVHSHYVRVFTAARTAPGCPEVDDFHFGFDGVHGKRLAFRRIQREIGSHLANGNGSQFLDSFFHHLCRFRLFCILAQQLVGSRQVFVRHAAHLGSHHVCAYERIGVCLDKFVFFGGSFFRHLVVQILDFFHLGFILGLVRLVVGFVQFGLLCSCCAQDGRVFVVQILGSRTGDFSLCRVVQLDGSGVLFVFENHRKSHPLSFNHQIGIGDAFYAAGHFEFTSRKSCLCQRIHFAIGVLHQ